MKKITTLLTMLATLVVFGLHVAPAQAQRTLGLARTFVSSLGNDANDCNRLTPCRTFQRAHDNTLARGEITVLDPGGYGAVTVNRAISIVNDGVGEASVLVSGGANGITVSAPADAAVSLRGLTVKGIGFGGGNGIVLNSGKSLAVENCVIRGLTGSTSGNGIEFFPTGSSSLTISNTLVADSTSNGISVFPSGSGITQVVLNRVEMYNNQTGLAVQGVGSTGTINATVADSVAAGNAYGFLVGSFAGRATTSLMLVRSVAANNSSVGIFASSPSLVRIGQSTVTGNAKGWQATAGGELRSYGDNNIDGNGDGDPAPLTIAKK